MKMEQNIILMTDSYKFGAHHNMLPDNTESVYSYGESRDGSLYSYTVFNGMQYIIKDKLAGVVVEQWMLEEAKEIAKCHIGTERAIPIDDWQKIIDVYGGKLPIEIRSVEEGAIVPIGNVLFTIRNTTKEFPWLTNYIESILMKVWYPTTVATRSHSLVSFIKSAFEFSSDDTNGGWKYMLHDFGYRSASSEESAAIGCSAHLINSLGTDSVIALKFLKEYYEGQYEYLGFSCPATEHSIATAYGKGVGELKYLRTMISRYSAGILSIVIDSHDAEKFITEVVPQCKDEIMDRWKYGNAPINRVVFRPDSPRFKGDTPEDQVIWLHEQLAYTFGSTTNNKGKRVLHPAVGVIYGDGLNEQDIRNIYSALLAEGWSVENCVVGQGGGLIQNLNRDTQRFAIKCSAQEVDGEWVVIRKTPTDTTKSSKGGQMKLFKQQNYEGYEHPASILNEVGQDWHYATATEDHPLYHDVKDELNVTFLNGDLTYSQDILSVRANAGLLTD